MAKCKVRNYVITVRRRRVTTRACAPNFSKRKSLHPTAPTLVEDCSEGQSMLTGGEQVILQTALIEAMDPGQSKSEFTRVLMDTSSQRTLLLKKSLEN